MSLSVFRNNVVSGAGVITKIRRTKLRTFLGLNCGAGFLDIQVLVDGIVDALSCGQSARFNGRLIESRGNKNIQSHEILCSLNGFNFLANKVLPFSSTSWHSESLSEARKYVHLRNFHPLFSSAVRLRCAVTHLVNEYFRLNDFCHVDVPMLCSNNCEGGSQVFTVVGLNQKHPFFNDPVYLTISGQLHLEAACIALNKVYTISPAFRAEPSVTRRHLAEFKMAEAEWNWVYDIHALMDNLETLVFFVYKGLQDHSSVVSALELLHKNLPETSYCLEKSFSQRFPRLSYNEAVEVLQKLGFTSVENDLSREEELALVKHYGDVPVFIFDYPKKSRPFYCRINQDSKTVAAFDLLLPFVGEVCGGSLREERVDFIKAELESKGMIESIKWYLELREHGGEVPHGGYGLGIDRLVQWLCGSRNILHINTFPRYLHYCPM